MALDNPLFKPRKTAPESVFIRGNREIIMSRIEELTSSLETTRNVMYLPKPVAELKEEAAGKAGKLFQQGAPIELAPEVVATPDLVAWTKQADGEAAQQAARQNVDQAYDGKAVEDAAVAVLPTNVAQIPLSHDHAAASRAVEAAFLRDDEDPNYLDEVA